ncbi:hypothetical protein NMS06_003559 [Vibrio cholerae]|nr:hypothetical protein [Vibrio cholerae]EJL6442184.1 hypothetical protein [Vibrio cholerae]
MTVAERTNVNIENTELTLEKEYVQTGQLRASESVAFPVLDGQELNITLNNPSNQYTVYYKIYNQATSTLFKSGQISPGKSLSYMVDRAVGFNSYRIQNTSAIIPKTGGQPYLGWLVIAD